jgi:hypothetical protein
MIKSPEGLGSEKDCADEAQHTTDLTSCQRVCPISTNQQLSNDNLKKNITGCRSQRLSVIIYIYIKL